MAKLAIRLQGLDADELEEFVELWAERRFALPSPRYVGVMRIGSAGDKGRDVVGFLSTAKHEGAWDLYQCKRKTVATLLGIPEALAELGKLFHHHVEGAYATLPVAYVFVAPRGIKGPLRDLVLNPTKLRDKLLSDWDASCARRITARATVPLSAAIRDAILGFDFSRVSAIVASDIVKDPAAGPAMSKLLHLPPEEAPPGVVPEGMQPDEAPYADQLRHAYAEAAGSAFATFEEVAAHPEHGRHFGRQRTRYFEAESFARFHRDNTAPGAVDTFKADVFHGVVEVHEAVHASLLLRVDAVMTHAGSVQVHLLGSPTRIPVRQGMCHHLVNDGKLKWSS